MRKIFFLAFAMVAACVSVHAEGFEDAFTAVANLGPGWNLGNTLDAHSGDLNDDENYETAWGQPKTTQALIHMFKEAGFNTIRVPVTWYPYVYADRNYEISEKWMTRVKEVVDYVIAEGMYCILNTHHDSGTHNEHHQIAKMDPTDDKKAYGEDEFIAIWTQIANAFKDYGDHLLFEGYNEILNDGANWGVPSGDNSHAAINQYASVFVSTVRGTGGNNEVRNLIINTYAASDAVGNISALTNPEKDKQLDDGKRHIICEVHMYPNTGSYKGRIDDLFNNIQTYFVNQQKAPCVIGEWGCEEQTREDEKKENNSVNIDQFSEMAFYLISRCKAEGVGAVMWMLLCEEADRSVPRFTTKYHGKDYSKVKDAIIRAWYSTDCQVKFGDGLSNSSTLLCNNADNSNQWAVDVEFGVNGLTVNSTGLTGNGTITAPKGYKISGVIPTSSSNVTIADQSIASGKGYVPQTPVTSVNIQTNSEVTELKFMLVADEGYAESHHNDFCTVAGSLQADTPVNFIANDNGAWYANEIRLTDDVNYTLDKAVNAKKFSFSREYIDTDALSNEYWQPLCVPVAVPYESWSMFAQEVLEFAGVTDDNGTVILQFDKVAGQLEANHPYIFKPATNKMEFVITPESTVAVSAATSAGSVSLPSGYTLHGTYSKIQSLESTAYALWNGAFHKPNGNVELKPFRVYLTVPSGSGAPARLNIAVGNAESGIEDVSVNRALDVDNAYYDMMGRRVTNPAPGLYIHQGRKVYIR